AAWRGGRPARISQPISPPAIVAAGTNGPRMGSPTYVAIIAPLTAPVPPFAISPRARLAAGRSATASGRASLVIRSGPIPCARRRLPAVSSCSGRSNALTSVVHSLSGWVIVSLRPTAVRGDGGLGAGAAAPP